jgi:hypothetical protein
MNYLVISIASLTVVCIYFLWRVYRFTQAQRERVLRDRVTYLLWTLAERPRESRTLLAGLAARKSP